MRTLHFDVFVSLCLTFLPLPFSSLVCLFGLFAACLFLSTFITHTFVHSCFQSNISVGFHSQTFQWPFAISPAFDCITQPAFGSLFLSHPSTWVSLPFTPFHVGLSSFHILPLGSLPFTPFHLDLPSYHSLPYTWFCLRVTHFYLTLS